MSDSVYKIFQKTEWESFQTQGLFAGSEHDLRDGFIHLCSAVQLPATLEKHYAGYEALVIARFDPKLLKNLKWEVSRGGEKFPHVYGQLPLTALQNQFFLHRDPQSGFDIPATFLGAS